MLLPSPSCPTIRVITRSAPNIESTFPPALRSPPHSIVIVNHYESDEFFNAFQGMETVFHDGLNVHPNEAAMGVTAMDASRKHGVKHFILVSILHPLRRKLQTHLNKLTLEEYLMESRLNYTILQPTHYMQNVAISTVRESGKIPIGFPSDIEHSFVDIVDVVYVSLLVMKNPTKHKYARYELVSQTLTYAQIAQTLSEALGREIVCDVIPTKEFMAMMESSGEIENEFTKNAIEGMMLYYDRWGLTGNSNVFSWLLGRQPVTWQEYARREKEKSDAI
ncbi:hypothetical protein M422DRAFT_45506 [Sphaerobolus stellatus SS14]|uniref:NmrA-like domain-containing protein n=1 Tax=Sphaerobolus stellatus (strain SS14) TaxID=990650 RepID=A0A0C9VWC5_SPHS4|nr:hypothetical protein M422DRAFT_45506 [Sphaerobolus stellatus SS14]